MSGNCANFDQFDVVGEITFSKRLGFLEQGMDVENIMSDIWHWFEYVAVVSLSDLLQYHSNADPCSCSRLVRYHGSITSGLRILLSLLFAKARAHRWFDSQKSEKQNDRCSLNAPAQTNVTSFPGSLPPWKRTLPSRRGL